MEKLGEIAIFKRTGLVPVFFARMIAGPRMPCLAYMLVRDSLAAREKNWSSFHRRSGVAQGRADAGLLRRGHRLEHHHLAAAAVGGVPDLVPTRIHMRLFQVLDAQGRLRPGSLPADADVATAGQAGYASTLDLLDGCR